MDLPPVLPYSSPPLTQGSVILFGVWISFLGKCKGHRYCDYPQEGTGGRDICWRPSSLPSTCGPCSQWAGDVIPPALVGSILVSLLGCVSGTVQAEG